MEYITIKQASAYLAVTEQLIYKQIRLYLIKAVKIDGKLHTTTQWLDEYEKKKGTSEHAQYKGRPINRPERGEYSVPYCAKVLGVNRMYILNRINRGKIATFRKGLYFVLPEHELKRLKIEVDAMREKEKTG